MSLYSGETIQCHIDENKFVHMVFNNIEGSANVIGSKTMGELPQAVKAIKDCADKKGLILRSEKSHFIFGADITEFTGYFTKSEEEIAAWISQMHEVFNDIEDIGVPSVTLINGFALGGGMETALSTDYRIASIGTKVGLPETKLGIIPGWGGTVRLPRLCGVDHAVEWITSGKQWKAEDALKVGAIDGVVPEEALLDSGIKFIKSCLEENIPWQKRSEAKKSVLRLSKVEATMAFESSKGFVGAIAGKHYPAPVEVIKLMESAAFDSREDAHKKEAILFAKMAKTDVADSLINVFLGDQYLKKTSKKATKEAAKLKQTAVLGAGIMGGGIAYQSSSKGVPIIMKDIAQEQLALGLNEANSLLEKQVKRKKINTTQMGQVLNGISPTLSYGDFNNVELTVEAVVENIKVKQSVLAELEDKVSEDSIIASNTSTISITELAKDLKRPENFCGMHFFNPVHRMPLVEVIRGEKTSEKAIAQTVKYALQMGKTPIVVNDCPGFLVNRVLFPYLNAFGLLIKDGVDYQRIDKVMEGFGWPMGPAYLADVVGIDTASHAANIMGDCFPDRMKMEEKTIIDILLEEKRLGQKTAVGFYSYEKDRKGKLKKKVDDSVNAIISKVVRNKVEVTDEEIIERMMLPMIFEAALCLEENIVNSHIEVDMGLLLGIGFPPFRMGALKYADSIGASNLVDIAKKYASLGAMYNPTQGIEGMAKEGKSYYGGAQ